MKVKMIEERTMFRRIGFRPSESVVFQAGVLVSTVLDIVHNKMDIAVFASSCENLPNILLECMASGLPIACSKNGPMPELLSSAGVYFEPTNPNSIAQALIKLMDSSSLRLKYSVLAYNNARKFSWEKTARTTFKYLAKLAIGK